MSKRCPSTHFILLILVIIIVAAWLCSQVKKMPDFPFTPMQHMVVQAPNQDRMRVSDNYEAACPCYIWEAGRTIDRRSAVTNHFVQLRLSRQGLVVGGTSGCDPGANICIILAGTENPPEQATLRVTVSGNVIKFYADIQEENSQTTKPYAIAEIVANRYALPTSAERYGLYIGHDTWAGGDSKIQGFVYPAYRAYGRGWFRSKTSFEFADVGPGCPPFTISESS